MFYKMQKDEYGSQNIEVSGLGFYNLRDTFECGQCFRHERIRSEKGYDEYMTVIGDKIMRVGQKNAGELIFYDVSDEEFENEIIPYFSLNTDYEKIREDIVKRTDSEWLKSAAEKAVS